MIDIHNHALFGVDDGAQTMHDSIAMLRDAKKQGIDTIILTPHYWHGIFSYPTEVIERNFQRLYKEAKEIKIELYLGCEYHVNSQMVEYLRDGRCHTLADTDYVLAEYEVDTEYTYIYEQTKKQLCAGYIPIIAHAERYECFQKKANRCKEISDAGALIQINADSILGLNGRKTGKICRNILKNRWGDIVASDSHDVIERTNHMKQCYQYVCRKYGEEYAKQLFLYGPASVLK